MARQTHMNSTGGYIYRYGHDAGNSDSATWYARRILSDLECAYSLKMVWGILCVSTSRRECALVKNSWKSQSNARVLRKCTFVKMPNDPSPMALATFRPSAVWRRQKLSHTARKKGECRTEGIPRPISAKRGHRETSQRKVTARGLSRLKTIIMTRWQGTSSPCILPRVQKCH